MGKIIAVANQKGGVGKTTTVINLMAGLGKAGKKCLLVDADPQGNSTSGLGINKRDVRYSTYDLLTREERAAEAILHTEYKNVDLIPSSMELAAAEIELVELQDRTMQLRQALVSVKDEYDYIMIDCPPSMGLTTLNAFSACDSVIIPIQCEYYALEGLSQLIHTVNLVKERLNPELEMEGVVFTMYDSRTNLSMQVVENVKQNLRQKVYRTLIPRNIRLAEAPSYGMPINLYDAKSAGAEAYMSLAAEVMGEK